MVRRGPAEDLGVSSAGRRAGALTTAEPRAAWAALGRWTHSRCCLRAHEEEGEWGPELTFPGISKLQKSPNCSLEPGRAFRPYPLHGDVNSKAAYRLRNKQSCFWNLQHFQRYLEAVGADHPAAMCCSKVPLAAGAPSCEPSGACLGNMPLPLIAEKKIQHQSFHQTLPQ